MRLGLALFFWYLSLTSIKAQVVINEVFPAPEVGVEWIELYNQSSQEIDLTGWSLTDQLSSPSIVARFEDQFLATTEILVIELSSAKLNNSADGVVLKNSLGEIIDQMSYEKSEAGSSWSRDQQGSYHLTQPSKEEINIFPSPSPSPSPSLIPTPSPTPALTTSSISSIKNNTPAIISPPSPPLIKLTPPQLNFNFEPTSTSSKLIYFQDKNFPKLPLLSVILGGSWLLLLGGWQVYEKIKSYFSSN